MTQRRGQAALEFLSTYGFAFLLILVMIGALSYFGVLNPKGLVPDRCVAPSEFSCADEQVRTEGSLATATDGALTLYLVNNVGSTIDVGPAGVGSVVTVNAPALPALGSCTITDSVAPGGRITIACATLNAPANSLPVGEKIKLTYNFTYNEPGKFAKSTAGEILTTVQP